MSWTVGDFLDQIESEIVMQRHLAAQHVDRAEALVAFRNRALTVGGRLNRPITVNDVFDGAANEQERAELRALADRITAMGSEPAAASESAWGYRLETAEGL